MELETRLANALKKADKAEKKQKAKCPDCGNTLFDNGMGRADYCGACEGFKSAK